MKVEPATLAPTALTPQAPQRTLRSFEQLLADGAPQKPSGTPRADQETTPGHETSRPPVASPTQEQRTLPGVGSPQSLAPTRGPLIDEEASRAFGFSELGVFGLARAASLGDPDPINPPGSTPRSEAQHQAAEPAPLRPGTTTSPLMVTLTIGDGARLPGPGPGPGALATASAFPEVQAAIPVDGAVVETAVQEILDLIVANEAPPGAAATDWTRLRSRMAPQVHVVVRDGRAHVIVGGVTQLSLQGVDKLRSAIGSELAIRGLRLSEFTINGDVAHRATPSSGADHGHRPS